MNTQNINVADSFTVYEYVDSSIFTHTTILRSNGLSDEDIDFFYYYAYLPVDLLTVEDDNKLRALAHKISEVLHRGVQ